MPPLTGQVAQPMCDDDEESDEEESKNDDDEEEGEGTENASEP